MTNFTKFPNWLLDSMHDISPNEWQIICYVIRKTRGFHRASHKASYQDIADGAGVSKRTVLRAMKKGVPYLHHDGEGYYISQRGDILSPEASEAVTKCHHDGDKMSPEGCQNVTANGDKMSPSTSGLKKKESIKESIKERPPHLQIQDFLQSNNICYVTGANNGTYESKWKQPIDTMLLIAGNDMKECEQRLIKTRDLMREKGYTIASPKSMLNVYNGIMDDSRDYDTIWEEVKRAVLAHRRGNDFFVVDDGITGVAKKMIGDIGAMNEYSEKAIKNVFVSRIKELK